MAAERDERTPDPRRGEETLDRLGDEPRGPARPGPDPKEGREREAQLGDPPHEPERPGPDPADAEEIDVRTDPDRPS